MPEYPLDGKSVEELLTIFREKLADPENAGHKDRSFWQSFVDRNGS
ncbi:MAG: hypothetical protein Q8P68_00220 [Candidatus Peregrinibacteria bacterium]|nr:hypothetical protein [Candidatus Peregrinibacteria bacterium]MDZ4244603.1 hypothetical protein [Candidatus Gracilibacteria bacterium]